MHVSYTPRVPAILTCLSIHQDSIGLGHTLRQLYFTQLRDTSLTTVFNNLIPQYTNYTEENGQ
jgi:hypothetical protein